MQRDDFPASLRSDKEAEDLAWLQAAIDKGRASGIDPRPAREVLADIVARHLARHKNSLQK